MLTTYPTTCGLSSCASRGPCVLLSFRPIDAAYLLLSPLTIKSALYSSIMNWKTNLKAISMRMLISRSAE